VRRGAENYAARYNVAQHFSGVPYVALHSLAHALMEEISLDCGYPYSLKERVYSIARNGVDQPDRFGILIYTASSGAQGTLGGLTAIAIRIPELVLSALDRLRLCSNDTPSAQTTILPSRVMSVHFSAQFVTLVSSSQKPAARHATAFLIELC
jgi:hypothetical protein